MIYTFFLSMLLGTLGYRGVLVPLFVGLVDLGWMIHNNVPLLTTGHHGRAPREITLLTYAALVFASHCAGLWIGQGADGDQS